MAHAYINVNDLVSNVIVNFDIKGARRLRWRLALAAMIFRFGGWVSGVTVNVAIGQIEIQH